MVESVKVAISTHVIPAFNPSCPYLYDRPLVVTNMRKNVFVEVINELFSESVSIDGERRSVDFVH